MAFTAPRGVEAQDTGVENDCDGAPARAGRRSGTWSCSATSTGRRARTEGRAVVGRDATFESFGVGTRLPPDRTRVDLAVGRDLMAQQRPGRQQRAARPTGGTISGVPDPTYFTKAAPPFDVGALFDALNIRSSYWATEVPANGTTGPHDDGSPGSS